MIFNANNKPYDTSDSWWCDPLREFVNRDFTTLCYMSSFRQFGLLASSDGTVIQEIYYCPFCGTQFPPSLRDDWFEKVALLTDPWVNLTWS